MILVPASTYAYLLPEIIVALAGALLIVADLIWPAYDPATGVSDAAFEGSLKSRITDGLGIPGFMHAQLFRRVAPPAKPPQVSFPRYLVIWETEASGLIGAPLGYQGAQSLQDALMAATKSGQMKPIGEDPATRQSAWWTPISPWIDKSMFNH